MADIELRVVNESGELVAINLDGTVDGKQVLRKEQIEALTDALVDLKLGNYSFDGSELIYTGSSVTSVAILMSNTTMTINDSDLRLLIYGDDIRFQQLTIPIIDDAVDNSAITKEWAFAKFTTPAYVDGKFGDYSFDGSEIVASGDVVIDYTASLFLNPDENLPTVIGGLQVLLNKTISDIDGSDPISLVSKEWTLAKFFQQSQFINDYTGTSAQPILTDLNGKIASSLLPTQSAPQGNFTPTGGQEYPTLSGNVAGDYWVINNVGAGYTFTGGDLVGEMIYESAWMVLDVNLNWILSNNYAGTVQAAWGSIIGTLADQTDLNNALGLKADQADLDTTNSNVSSNTVAIGNKANQSALDTTNTNVSTNADDIDANTIAIGLRATQADLDTTNTNVTDNANDILDLQGKIADYQADSTATSMGALVADFNSLLSKLKDAGLMANS